jgi:hypothetical protein
MKRLGYLALLLVGVSATAAAQQPPADKDEVPAAYKPPKGMCRIWLKDVPPQQQPAPTDCAAAVKNAPKTGRVVFGDTEEAKKDKPKIALPKDTKGYAGKGAPPAVVIPKKPPFVR